MPIAKRTRLGSYKVLSPLGAGGVGEVYPAEDTRLHRKVALKILAAELASDRNAPLTRHSDQRCRAD